MWVIRSIWDPPQAHLSATAAVPDFTRRDELQHASEHFIHRSPPVWELNMENGDEYNLLLLVPAFIRKIS